MPTPARPARGDDPRHEPGHRRPGRGTKEATTTHPTPTPRAATRPTPAGDGRPTPGRNGRHRPGATCAQRGRLPVARRLAIIVGLTLTLVVVVASPAYAAGGGTQTLSGLISNLTTWIVGILAGVATLFLTIGGLRYLTAGGDPGQVEKAKTALKSAAVGYALAVLAPLIVSILASLVGGG